MTVPDQQKDENSENLSEIRPPVPPLSPDPAADGMAGRIDDVDLHLDTGEMVEVIRKRPSSAVDEPADAADVCASGDDGHVCECGTHDGGPKKACRCCALCSGAFYILFGAVIGFIFAEILGRCRRNRK